MSSFPIGFCGHLHGFRNHYILLTLLYLMLVTIVVQRVKVYRLNEDGQWDDRGTGHVTMDYMEVCSSSWIPPAAKNSPVRILEITCS